MNCREKRSPLMGKFFTARAVCASRGRHRNPRQSRTERTSLKKPDARRHPRAVLGDAVAEQRRHAIAERVTVATPDPFINAAAAALNIAADGVWDEAQQLAAFATKRRALF